MKIIISDKIKTAIFFILNLTIIVIERLHTFHEPIERDLSGYAVAGHALNEGSLLYTSVWDHKGPLPSMTYAFFERIFGYNELQIFAIGCFFAAATAVAIFLILHLVTKKLWPAYFGTFIWVFISWTLELQANQPNVEVFINAFSAFSFYFFLKGGQRNLIIAAVLAAITGCYKLNSVLFFPMLILTQMAISLVEAKMFWSDRLIEICKQQYRAWIAFLVILLLPALYFALNHRFDDYFNATVVYNRWYAGDIVKNLLMLLNPRFFFPDFMRVATGLLLGSVLFLFVPHRKFSFGIYFYVFLIASILAMALPGNYFPHYYQLLLPALCLCTTLLFWYGFENFETRQQKIVLAIFGLGLFLQIIGRQIANARLSPADWCLTKYGHHGEFFVKTQRLGKKLGETLKPDERIYNWGSESGVLFYAGRNTASGVFYNYPLLAGPLQAELNSRVIQEFEANPPAVIVMTDLTVPQGGASSAYTWIRQNYENFPCPFEPTFQILVRRLKRPLDLQERLTTACR